MCPVCIQDGPSEGVAASVKWPDAYLDEWAGPPAQVLYHRAPGPGDERGDGPGRGEHRGGRRGRVLLPDAAIDRMHRMALSVIARPPQ